MKCMEKVLWLTECVKSGLWFPLDMFHGRVDRLKFKVNYHNSCILLKLSFKNWDRIDT